MAYDEGLAERIRDTLGGAPGIAERKMFGGIAFLLHGNMFVGVVGSTLMVRVGPQQYDAALRKPHAREMDFTGKPLRGYVYVDEAGTAADYDLAAWVARARGFAAGLPVKKEKIPLAKPRRREGREGEKKRKVVRRKKRAGV